MNILITGATGYVGSSLAMYLKKNSSNEIITLCRKLPYYFKDWVDLFKVLEVDVTQLEDLKKKVPKKIDTIIHLAASNNIDTMQNPEKALIINGIGTRNMLEIARERKCKSFIYFSVLQVYGKELQGIITVNSSIKCEDDYSLTHYLAEEYCRMYALRYNINVDVLRLSNIFSCPKHQKIDRWSIVPLCLCMSAYEDNEIRLKSSGKQVRDFVSIYRVIKSIEYLMKEKKRDFNIYNLTSENTFSILEVAKMVQSCAELMLKKRISLICESKYPLDTNQFLAKNNLLGPLKREKVQCELLNEIKKTLILLVRR